MAWSKGAVVVVKHGDPEMADEMEKIFRNSTKSSGGGYCFLPHRHTTEELRNMIEDARITYGNRYRTPEWLKPIKEGCAFIVYHICKFIERYLVL